MLKPATKLLIREGNPLPEGSRRRFLEGVPFNKTFSRFALAVALGFVAPSAPCVARAADTSGIEQLTERLRSSDFRVQVQAALLLGKTGDARALSALTDSLRDRSVAVRAAAAAALGTLGDPAALPALRRCEEDTSAAVRRRVLATISALETRQKEQLLARRRAKILVKFDHFDGRTNSPEAMGAVAHASRLALEDMSEIAVLNPSEDPTTAARRHDRPVIVMRVSLRRLSSSSDGDDTVISANIEFLLERYPEHSIIGRLVGNASAQSLVESQQARAKLQEEAVFAAVSSALRQSEQALISAVHHG